MRLLKDHWLAAALGALFGLFTPVIGVFLGLQVSSVLGNIFAWPLIAMSALTGEPFGHFSGLKTGLTLALSGLLWAFIFARIARLARPTEG